MTQQIDLVQAINQTYVIDSCAILDFWGSVANFTRPYDIEVAAFRRIWNQIAQLVTDGVVVIPEVIYKEVDETTEEELHKWLLSQRKLFPGYEDSVDELSEIVNEFKIYTTKRGSINDAIVVALAKHHRLTVVTSERKSTPTSYNKPMIPNVCDFFNVRCINLAEFFKEIEQLQTRKVTPADSPLLLS